MANEKFLNPKTALDFSKLESTAFPNHPFSIMDLRKAAYKESVGEQFPEILRNHILECNYCKQELMLLKRIDPVLIDEEQKKIKVLIEAVQNPKKAVQIEKKAFDSIQLLLKKEYGKKISKADQKKCGSVRIVNEYVPKDLNRPILSSSAHSPHMKSERPSSVKQGARAGHSRRLARNKQKTTNKEYRTTVNH